jgi:polysaccharide biosynthesis transport protein
MNSENLPVLSAKNGETLHLAQEAARTFDSEVQPEQSGIGFHDLLFVLFRHKWKIIFFGLAGILAAAAIYVFIPPDYESQAKLLVRYVVDRSAVDGLDSQIKTPTAENHAVINSELQILTSSDLIRQVAESVDIDKLAPNTEAGSNPLQQLKNAMGLKRSASAPKPAIEKAVETIYQSLEVSVVPDTNIIVVTFRSSDPDLPKPLLSQLIKRYFDKHLEVHRSTGAFEFVARETADLKKVLSETEAELKRLKDSAGIISLAETKSDLAAEFGKTQQELDTAEAELAGQRVRVSDIETALTGGDPHQSGHTALSPLPTTNIITEYQSLITRLNLLQQSETELLSKYTPQNPVIRVKAAQIADLEKQRDELVKKYPALLETAPASAASGGEQMARPNLASERAILAGMESKVKTLKVRMSYLETRAKAISEVAPRIEELERKKEVEETKYKNSEASLEKARIDETLDPSRMPNISIVQTPSPAIQAKRNLEKVVAGVAVAGFAVGIAIAMLIELILDRTVKRSTELETGLRVPLLLTVPYITSGRAQPRLRDTRKTPDGEHTSGRREISLTRSHGELLRPFCEAIRDRLGVFFLVNNASYKPKLVGVTGLTENAGASTLAAGLAEAFSDDSEGKVLLIDKPVPTKQFYDMLTEFKRSDFDYVVFDLPRLGDTSSTLPLARFMDTVLLVVEAGKSSRKAVKRAYAQLAASANVSVIFNKGRSCGPKWLEGNI